MHKEDGLENCSKQSRKNQENMNNSTSVLDVQTKNEKMPHLLLFFFSILNVVEQVVFSLIPEKEKGSANLLFLNNIVLSLYHKQQCS